MEQVEIGETEAGTGTGEARTAVRRVRGKMAVKSILIGFREGGSLSWLFVWMIVLLMFEFESELYCVAIAMVAD